MAGADSVSIVILAGGLGSRMGGDKAMRDLRGQPLIKWVIDALLPQADEILISANGNQAALAKFGFPVVPDVLPDYAGPLAGLQAGLRHARGALVASVPCDTPNLPDDLIARLYGALGDAEGVVAVAAGKRQPAIALYRKDVLPRLEAFLASGLRKVSGWLDTLQIHEVVFEDARAFLNVNSLAELDAMNDGQGENLLNQLKRERGR
jgi:molybdopterin-guanine dinucleotide biosynthesis protein A